jgi:hypothetical protein
MLAQEFERRYLELFWKRQRYQWDNYVAVARHDLSAVDDEIFKLVASCRDTFEFSGRRGEVINTIMIRELVDKHPDVAQLRNRLDDWDNYAHGLSTAQKQDSAHYRLIVAQRMRHDVLQLMKIRQHLAQDLGFPSYVALVLSTEGLELESLITLLEQYLKDNLMAARALVKTHHLSWPTWFCDLDAIGHIDQDLNPPGIITPFLERAGFGQLQDTILSISQEQAIAGYAGILSVPNDIRILIRPVRSLRGWLTLFHELGHGIAHALNVETGVFRTWTGVYDETMAVVIEHIAAFMLLDQTNQEAAQALSVLESTRCAISALFELALWDHPEAAERLYVQHYSQLGFNIVSPEIWAVDSFRSIDPVYIHNYVIGALVANSTISLLNQEYGDDFQQWGEWLNSNYYVDGRGRSLQEKAEVISGLV